MRDFDDLIAACKDRVRPAPHEYPIHDYPWGIREVGGVDELIEQFQFGNYSVRTGFVLGDLAFIEQVSGGNEWLAMKLDGGEWKSFDSISFYHIINNSGADACGELIEYLRETPWHNLKYPSEPESAKSAAYNTVQRSIAMLKDKIHAEIERAGAGGKRKEMEQIREYVTAYENGPPLVANGLDKGYRILGEFGGHVLAGFKYSGDEAADGYQFATWQYVNNKTAVEHGHYYPTWSFGTNAFDLSKQDFALRSGLVDENLVFNQGQYVQMYEALDFYTRMNGDVLTSKHEEYIMEIMGQIEGLLPEYFGQEEPIQGPKMGM